jgi:hypothetical protein
MVGAHMVMMAVIMMVAMMNFNIKNVILKHCKQTFVLVIKNSSI